MHTMVFSLFMVIAYDSVWIGNYEIEVYGSLVWIHEYHIEQNMAKVLLTWIFPFSILAQYTLCNSPSCHHIFPLVCFDKTTVCFSRIIDPASVDSIEDFTKIRRSFCQPQSSCIHNWGWQPERVKKQFLHPLWERLEIQLQPRLGPTIKHHEVLLR